MSAEVDLKVLTALGRRLDDRPEGCKGATIREVLMPGLLKIRDKQGRLAPFVLNRAQREFQSRCGHKNIVLKARQLGLTTYVAGRFFLQTITRPGTLSVQVAHDQRSAEEIFRIVHRFLENLPERLRKGALVTSRENARQIVFPRLDSGYRVETAADPNAGRGLTIRNLHCSEVARWPRDAAGTLASLRAAVPTDGEVVLESTPNGAGGCFYDEWQRAEVTGHVRHFFPWWWEPVYRREGVVAGELTEEERDLVKRYGLDSGQIAFRREMRANFGTRAAEEFAEDAHSCFRASGECVFDMAMIEARLASRPEAVEHRENGRLQVWWPPQTGREYVIGVDPAGGGADGDFACAQVIERSTGLQCAEWHGHCTPTELARRSAELAREYNGALLAVERNNHGHAVLAQLATSEAYENVYRTGGQAGWLTSAATRPRMIENFAAVLRAAPQLFSSIRLLKECRTFVRHADGSTAAASGAHDDTVMAMAVALAVRAECAGRVAKAETVGVGVL
ncbi:MAG TPA: terminase [Clostridia bacterium]|nr:terminase [Clostridia bacterium]